MKAEQQGFNPDYSPEAPTPDEIAALPGAALLEFGAPWCGHCQAARAAIEEALSDHPQLPHIKVYDGQGKPLGRAFRVKLWPTLIMLLNGEEQARLVRPTKTDEVRKALSSIT